MKEISGMYLNIFDVFQGAMIRELFAAVTIPSPTTKISTMVFDVYSLLRNVRRLRKK
jgi:hypothetical protein